MPTLVSVRLPNTLIHRISEIEEAEDKNRTSVIITLLEEALNMRDFNKNRVDDGAKTELELLKEKCGLDYILEMKHVLGELARYTYSHEKSSYQDETKSANATLSHIAKKVEEKLNKVKEN